MSCTAWTGIVTWHQGRCGSSVLGSLLNQHSHIQASNEIFSRYMPRRWGNRPVPPINQVLQEALSVRNKPFFNIEIKSLLAQNRSLYPGIALGKWFEFLFNEGFHRQVVLCRRHGLRRLISHLLAQRSGIFVQSMQDPIELQEPLWVNTTAIREGACTYDLLHWLDLYASTHAELLSTAQRFSIDKGLPAPLLLFYEDSIESDPLDAYMQFCGWLGLHSEPVSVQHRRINVCPLPQLISNWNEIELLLKQTPHSWMLD